jgi:uncharacterized membrane protein (DUF4010 family)
MNKGIYGYPLAPGVSTRIAPPEWRSYKLFGKAGTYTGEIVPVNVYQMLVCVWGAGGCGYYSSPYTGGGGGGFAMGIIDVVPGSVLPTITIGQGLSPNNTAASGTS